MLHFRHTSRFPKRSFYLNLHLPVTAFVIVLFVVLATVSGCGDDLPDLPDFSFKDPNVEPIKAVVRTTVPLAYAASVAMSSVTGNKPSNAAFVYNDCTTTPDGCAAVLRIDDDDSSMPLQLTSSGPGTIWVYGYWISADDAILAVAFSDDAGSMLFPVHNISMFPVSRGLNGNMKIVYTNVDVNVATIKDPRSWTTLEMNGALMKLSITASSDPYDNIDVDAWIIEINDGNTPDFSDDTYSISGAGTYMGGDSESVSSLQLAMAEVVIGSDCLLNPDAGLALVNELKAPSELVVATAMISFQPPCEGNALVMLATGNYIKSFGQLIPLDWNTP